MIDGSWRQAGGGWVEDGGYSGCRRLIDRVVGDVFMCGWQITDGRWHWQRGLGMMVGRW